MRRVITACTVALCLAAATANAQDDATIKSKTKIKADDGKVVTATGCLMNQGASYTLARATPVTVEKSVSVGTSGTIVSYTVIPRDGVDLTTHVGQMVEVTGVMIPASKDRDDKTKIKVEDKTKADIDDAPDATAKSKTKVEVPQTAVPQLAVTSVKMVGQTCVVQ